MTKKNPVYLTVLLVALASVLTFQMTMIMTDGYDRLFSGSSDKSNDAVESDSLIDAATLAKLKEIAAKYAAFFPGEIDSQTIEEYLVTSFIAGAGDTFGNYISSDEVDDFLGNINGNFKGIGVSVIYSTDTGGLEIVSVFADSPAEKAGILPGDIITHVGTGEDRQSVSELGYYRAIEFIKGEEGTHAKFVIFREGEQIEFSVERADVTNETVQLHMYEYDSRVAVIRITQFEKVTLDQFKGAMDKAKTMGAEAYVFDVRSNPGGELNTIVSILDMLLPEGPIIRIQYKNSQNNVQMGSDAACITAPMAVLCNSSTASAGELFCSALQDYGKAKLIGTRTYGKGTMQSMMELSDGSAVSMTVAYYLPPFSDNYHGVGVTPDIECEISEQIKNINLNKYTDENDNQLREAVAALGLSAQ